ncbi:hypothetical protein [Herpetosiphon giganteus]|uniref:hypothetical protein n=1 Tax=Herpetosiphon giganteus TaxID=2029754 RepID=UPI00195B7CC2|nr:hypothetical protein [Herpetosiphon giganteus]MBM7846629.1 hypothetical protein [Herpetosiphon giganteus]
MEPDYHVPANRSPYRWRMIIRLIIAVLGGFFPMIYTIVYQLYFYLRNMARGGTVEGYLSLRPWLWSMLPLGFALGWLLIGIGRDSWLLVKRRGTSTVIPIPYWLTLLFAVIAVVLYVLNIRIP